MRSRIVLSVFLSVLMIAAPTFAATHHVSMHNSLYIPQTLQAAVGDSVIWTNTEAAMPHTVTSGTNCNPDGLWDSGNLNAGQSYTRVFSSAGQYPYFCNYHCLSGMTGTVDVLPTPANHRTWGKIKTIYR